jgi:hypothetical protein
MQIRGADHGTELFRQKEAGPVVDQRAPVLAPNHVALGCAEAGLFEQLLRVGEKLLAPGGNDQLVQKLVEAVGFDAALERKGIGARQLLDAHPLPANVFPVLLDRFIAGAVRCIFIDDGRDRRHRRQ